MGARVAAEVTAAQAVAHRAAVHHLGQRLSPGRVAEAAASCPLQDSTPAAAAMSLSARVDGLVPAEVERALLWDRTLVRLPSLRGVTHVLTAHGSAAFGHGALAADESSLRDQLLGDWLAVQAAGWRARDALAVVAGVLAAALVDGVPRTVHELAEAFRDGVPPELRPWCTACQAYHVPDRLLRLAGTAGAFCYGRPYRGEETLVSLDAWLGGPLGGPGSGGGDGDGARVELARRFLRAFAPAVPEHLAACAGIGVEDARARFARLAFETVEVRFGGRPAWVLASDVEALADPPAALGVRLLPPDDPFLHQRDRTTLLPDAESRQLVWDADERPGVVLVDGWPAATWHALTFDDCFDVTVELLPGRRLQPRDELHVEDEAEVLAPFFGCDRVALRIIA